jgi:membrane-bound lytic murein transglycosylase D
VKVADNPAPRPEEASPAIEKVAFVAPIPVAPVSVAAAAPAVIAKAPAPAAHAHPDSYKVRPGDTLYSIALRFGTTVDALTALNKLAGTAIQAGLTLRLR